MSLIGSEERFLEVKAVKETLSRELMPMDYVQGVGIGVNDKRDDLAVNVMVRNRAAVSLIPRERDGVDVCVRVVGEIVAH